MSSTSRRKMLLGGSALAASTWIAPSVLSLDRVAAATPSGHPGGCVVTTTQVDVKDPPPDIRQNVVESDTESCLFVENECFTLPVDVLVNRSTPGVFLGNSNENAIIPAGTPVRSYFLSIDRATSGALSGSATFDTQILGLIYLAGAYNASSALFQSPGTLYSPSSGGPMFEQNDSLTLSTNTVSWTAFMAGRYSDIMRIIVAC